MHSYNPKLKPFSWSTYNKHCTYTNPNHLEDHFIDIKAECNNFRRMYKISTTIRNLKIFDYVFNYITCYIVVPYKQKIWHGIKFGGWRVFLETAKFISPIACFIIQCDL